MCALNNGYLVEYVPIDYLKRTGSSKIRPLQDTLNFLLLILRITLLFNPLKIFLPLGGVFFLTALVTWGVGLATFGRLFDNLILFQAELGTIAIMIGMLADLINVRLRR